MKKSKVMNKKEAVDIDKRSILCDFEGHVTRL